MDSRSLILVALLSTLFLNLPSQTEAINGVPVQTLIDNACKRSKDYKSCLVILRQSPETSLATDALSLAKIALQLVIKQSSLVVAFIDHTEKSHPEAAKPLGQCSSIFQGTEKQLIVGDDDWRAGVATLDINYALDSVGICEGSLQGAKVDIPELGVLITKWKTVYYAAYGATAAAEGLVGIIDILMSLIKCTHEKIMI